MADGWTVRPWVEADRVAIRARWVQLVEHHRELYANEGIGDDDPGAELDEHLEHARFGALWVAEAEDGGPVGLSGTRVEGTEVEGEPIIVARGWRGSGVGSDLLAAARDWAIERGARMFKARPVARNVRTLDFFHGHGMTVIGHVELFEDLAGPQERWIEEPSFADRRHRV